MIQPTRPNETTDRKGDAKDRLIAAAPDMYTLIKAEYDANRGFETLPLGYPRKRAEAISNIVKAVEVGATPLPAAANARLIAAAPDLLAACEACAAWHWAEREVPKRLTTFDERMALCRYSEWMTLRALTVASGKSPDSEPYAGLLCVWTGRRPTSEQERVVVDRILCEYRASIAKAEGGAA